MSKPQVESVTDVMGQNLESGKLVGEDCSDLDFDRKKWDKFELCFARVQALLDHNRVLIGKINQNHQSGISERITSNVDLINQLNKNLTKVQKMYAAATVTFDKCFVAPPIPAAQKSMASKAATESTSVSDIVPPETSQTMVPSTCTSLEG